MVFSSIEFLFYFLPLTLFLYFIVPKKYKNFVLMVLSLLFYSFGEPIYILIMLVSIIVDYTNGVMIGKTKKKRVKWIYLLSSLIINLGLLGLFKYSPFLIGVGNDIFNSNLTIPVLKLPIGISFYTFQTLSYTIDVYRGKVKTQKNIINFALYVSLFPQLIAGPIVRYKDICHELDHRKNSINNVTEGFQRFIYGLSKKVILANNIGLIASQIKSEEVTTLGTVMYLFAFGFQIYFDFSGYSDMAIGLGKVFGFTFPENFNYPYISKSITEFWRRWHMTLGTWFRDYIYFPLGGSRVKHLRLVINLFIVWFLTGLWHGAAYNFILWGLYFLIVLLIEKFFLNKYLKGVLAHIYVIVVVLFGWLLFSTESLLDIWVMLQSLFSSRFELTNDFTNFIIRDGLFIYLMCVVFSTPIFRLYNTTKVYQKVEPIISIILLAISVAYIVDSGFNPFLYFRF